MSSATSYPDQPASSAATTEFRKLRPCGDRPSNRLDALAILPEDHPAVAYASQNFRPDTPTVQRISASAMLHDLLGGDDGMAELRFNAANELKSKRPELVNVWLLLGSDPLTTPNALLLHWAQEDIEIVPGIAGFGFTTERRGAERLALLS